MDHVRIEFVMNIFRVVTLGHNRISVSELQTMLYSLARTPSVLFITSHVCIGMHWVTFICCVVVDVVFSSFLATSTMVTSFLQYWEHVRV